jgi:hypothetical protein
MDQQRFDAAIRALNTGTTRRSGIAAALGMLLGGVGIAASDAKQKNRKDGAGSQGKTKDKPEAEGPCGDGTWRDNRCKKHSECCTGYCKDGSCRGVELGGKCSKTRKCRGDAVCTKGKCVRKNGPKPTSCTPKNCADGCCKGTTCVKYATQSAATCGKAGAACAACGTGESCVSGVCGIPCDATSCGDSCCLDAITCRDKSLACGVTAGGACPALVEGLQTANGTGTAATSNTKGSYLSKDKLTLYIASWVNLGNDPWSGKISIWSRASVSDAWTWKESLTSTNLHKPEFVTVSDDGNTVATMSVWNDCGVVWKKANGVWTESTGTLGVCGSDGSTQSNWLSDPSAVALNADGTTAYVADKSNGRIAIFKLVNGTWTYDTYWGVEGGGGQCGTHDGTTKTCAKSVFVNADETKIYIVTGNSSNSFQLVSRSNASAAWPTATGAWAGPTEAAPYGGTGCFMDVPTETVFCPTGTEVKVTNFTSGTSWDAVTIPAAFIPAATAVNVSVRDYNATDSTAAYWSFAEGFSYTQVRGWVCPV